MFSVESYSIDNFRFPDSFVVKAEHNFIAFRGRKEGTNNKLITYEEVTCSINGSFYTGKATIYNQNKNILYAFDLTIEFNEVRKKRISRLECEFSFKEDENHNRIYTVKTNKSTNTFTSE